MNKFLDEIFLCNYNGAKTPTLNKYSKPMPTIILYIINKYVVFDFR